MVAVLPPAFQRNRAFLADLQRRKAFEREVAEASRNIEDEKRERGFVVCFSGANKHAGPPAFRAFGARPPLLRVPGALPLPRRRLPANDENRPRPAQNAAPAESPAHPPATAPPKRLRPLPVVPQHEAVIRCPRRCWEKGRPVTLKTADGEFLLMMPAAPPLVAGNVGRIGTAPASAPLAQQRGAAPTGRDEADDPEAPHSPPPGSVPRPPSGLPVPTTHADAQPPAARAAPQADSPGG